MNDREDLRAREKRLEQIRSVASAVTVLAVLAGSLVALLSAYQTDRLKFAQHGFSQSDKIALVTLVTASLFLLTSLALTWRLAELRRRQKDQRLEQVEEEFRSNPEKPQLAWDLARTKLESYLDRNLGQTVWIFWLTLIVMAAGFFVVVMGIFKSFEQPMALAISIVSSASGIIISFLGASFLLIYRSVAEQTRSYVSVLERINAVGMAVQVLTTVSDDGKELRNQATVTLAKQLLDLYAGDKRQPT
jgi:hypothetical protein